MKIPRMSKARYLGYKIVSNLIDDGISVENSPAIKTLDSIEETIRDFNWWNYSSEGKPENGKFVLFANEKFTYFGTWNEEYRVWNEDGTGHSAEEDQIKYWMDVLLKPQEKD